MPDLPAFFRRDPHVVLSRGDDRGVPFRVQLPINPRTFDISTRPEYARLGPLGLSHGVLNYLRTGSTEVRFQALYQRQVVELQLPRAMTQRDDELLLKFFLGLVAPLAQGDRPPLVRLQVGRFLNLLGIVERADVRVARIDRDGIPYEYTTDVEFVEQRTVFRDQALVHSFGYIG